MPHNQVPCLRMVVGFAFSETGVAVVMIHKNRGPAAVVGRLNGVGGKIEPGETPAAAMAREFEEEAGVRLAADRWSEFAVLDGGHWMVHCFAVVLETHELTAVNLAARAMNATGGEAVLILDPERVATGRSGYPIVANLAWLIPLAMDSQPRLSAAIDGGPVGVTRVAYATVPSEHDSTAPANA